jgi:DNA-binding PadR family transcriptional regulator
MEPDPLAPLRRFADPGLLILSSLAEGEKHGYAISHDIERFSGQRVGPGTLYGALGRLEGRGLIEPTTPEGRRRPYRLTGAGRAALRTQLASLKEFSTIGLRRLGEA